MPSKLFYPVPDSEDGYILQKNVDCNGDPVSPPNYAEYNIFNIRIDLQGDFNRRGFYFYDTSGFDFTGQTITKIEKGITCQLNDSSTGLILNAQALKKSDYASAEDLYNGLDDGPAYDTFVPSAFTQYVRDQGSNAITDFLANSKLSLGFGALADAPGNILSFYSVNVGGSVWAPLTTYMPGENVTNVNADGDTIAYKALTGHISSVSFAADYALGLWLQLTPFLKITYTADTGNTGAFFRMF